MLHGCSASQSVGFCIEVKWIIPQAPSSALAPTPLTVRGACTLHVDYISKYKESPVCLFPFEEQPLAILNVSYWNSLYQHGFYSSVIPLARNQIQFSKKAFVKIVDDFWSLILGHYFSNIMMGLSLTVTKWV